MSGNSISSQCFDTLACCQALFANASMGSPLWLTLAPVQIMFSRMTVALTAKNTLLVSILKAKTDTNKSTSKQGSSEGCCLLASVSKRMPSHQKGVTSLQSVMCVCVCVFPPKIAQAFFRRSPWKVRHVRKEIHDRVGERLLRRCCRSEPETLKFALSNMPQWRFALLSF